MKATEFRIGNIAIVQGIKKAITGWDIYCADENKAGIDINIDTIPLTEEWLLNLGLTFSEAFKDHFYKHIEGQKLFSVFPFSTKPFCRITEGDFAIYNMPCRFIHQLQNLYFALTGEELTIKEKATAQ